PTGAAAQTPDGAPGADSPLRPANAASARWRVDPALLGAPPPRPAAPARRVASVPPGEAEEDGKSGAAQEEAPGEEKIESAEAGREESPGEGETESAEAPREEAPGEAEQPAVAEASQAAPGEGEIESTEAAREEESPGEAEQPAVAEATQAAPGESETESAEAAREEEAPGEEENEKSKPARAEEESPAEAEPPAAVAEAESQKTEPTPGERESPGEAKPSAVAEAESQKTEPTPGEEESAERGPEPEPEPELRATSKMKVPTGGDETPRPVFVSALRMTGEVDREFLAEGEVELRKLGSVVNSDLMTYWPLEDEIEAEGRVRLQKGEDVVSGPKMRLRLEEQVGHFDQPFFQFKHQSLLGNRRDAEREESARRVDELMQGAVWESGFATPQTMGFAYGSGSVDKVELSRATETRGDAERIEFEGENQYRLINNTFTSCKAGDDSWYLKTNDLKLDYDSEEGEGHHAMLYFQNMPILYFPYLWFPLNNERKSGFLPMSIGTSSDNGFEYLQPYYWNIAPNMDATFYPRLMSKRGLQIGSEFRYLNTALGGVYRGTVKAEYLPSDRLRGGNRHAISLDHTQTTNKGFSGSVSYNKVSDDDYYTDLETEISRTSQTQLLQQATLNYGGGWWSASANFQQYQTLQPDRYARVLEQYRMLPKLTFQASKLDFHGADLKLTGEHTRFSLGDRDFRYLAVNKITGKEETKTGWDNRWDGNRTVIYPQISLPYVTPGWYVTPKFGVNYRHYSIGRQAVRHAHRTHDSLSVTLPVFTLDSGMTFERQSRWFGRDYVQTLEPRLYYVNIPYKDQSAIPLFDTGQSDFNFAQIFSENQFSSWDRINDANQVTAGLTSRLIEPDTGAEIMRTMIGQRFYFKRSKVALGSVSSSNSNWERSDFLASFSGQVFPKVFVDSSLQFSQSDRKTRRFSIEARYRPEPGKLLNIAYRYNFPQNWKKNWATIQAQPAEEHWRYLSSLPINQIDVSGQWPLFGRWHGVGRLNYSLKDDGVALTTGGQGGRIIESIAGLEYNGGCWILRGVVRRQALTYKDASTAFFVQLELSGLGRLGSNPLSMLKRNIPGYGLIGNDDESVFDK
ncbi:MAG: LPS assembly protein LptD, partial [Candidatus Accumulibacter sp.]|nr:LPS assembly protein LptD [Accumulibacter sp.]